MLIVGAPAPLEAPSLAPAGGGWGGGAVGAPAPFEVFCSAPAGEGGGDIVTLAGSFSVSNSASSCLGSTRVIRCSYFPILSGRFDRSAQVRLGVFMNRSA